MKAGIYQALNTINRGFADAIEALNTLQIEGVITELYVQDQTTFLQELLAGINSMVLDRQKARENEDWDHFGKMRLKIEERNRCQAGDAQRPGVVNLENL